MSNKIECDTCGLTTKRVLEESVVDWIVVRVGEDLTDGDDPLHFCSWRCVQQYAEISAKAQAEEGEPDGEDTTQLARPPRV